MLDQSRGNRIKIFRQRGMKSLGRREMGRGPVYTKCGHCISAFAPRSEDSKSELGGVGHDLAARKF